MAWTTPRTWVTSETVTASLMNTHVRDNLLALGDVRTTYTPTLGSWTLGNGSVSGRYIQAGKQVIGQIRFSVGSTTAFSGGPTFTLPTASRALLTGRDPVGSATLFDNSVNAYRHWVAVLNTTGTIAAVNPDGTGITPTAPWTWANTDVIVIQFEYEAA